MKKLLSKSCQISLILSALVVLTPAIASAQQTPQLYTGMGETGQPIKTFTLKDQNGEPFTPEKLRGKVWVAHFFYTTCTEGCEKTIARMRELQDAVRGKNDLALVSVSVNPEHDTANLLASFARDVHAEPGQWTFLSGPPDEVRKIVQESFFQTAQLSGKSDKGKEVVHGFNLLVVDREGKIVGYYNAKENDSIEPLLGRIRSLASERYVLPAVNAMLNGLAGFLLVVGYIAIRWRQIALHKGVMLTALACSTIFLASYLFYHFAVLRGQSPRLVGPGAVRMLYLAILLTHTVLAVVVAPLAIYVTVQGLANNLTKHVRIARWTLPIWLYVSVTGVVVYVMLYQLYPPY